MEKIKINNIEVDNFSFEEALEKIIFLSNTLQKNMVFTPNLDHLAELSVNDLFLKAYKDAKILIPDGMPLLWLSKLRGTALKERISGADIFKSIFDKVKNINKKILIMGGNSENEAEFIKAEINKIYSGINLVVLYPDFGFEKNINITKKLIDNINDFYPEILFICTGTPKSEIWLFENKEKINFNVALSVGAAPQFLTGIKKRAPSFIQKIGLEWFYRLLSEPRRLFNRYIMKDLPFLIKFVLKELFNRKE